MPKRKKIRTVNTIAFKSKDYEDILSEKQACDLFALTQWTNSIIPLNSDAEDPETIELMHDSIVESQILQIQMAIEEIEIYNVTMYGLIAIDNIQKGKSIIYAAKQHTMADVESTTDDFYKILLNESTVISAKDFGNMARFMNHAPEQEDISNILDISEEDMATLATANFTSKRVQIGNLEYVVLTANRNIRAGERLYWDYGLEYFQNIDISIALFKQDGSIISPDKYKWKNQSLQFKIHDELVVFENLDEILKNDGIVESVVTKHTPPYYITIHARYIKEILEQNPSLADNYYVKIPTPDLNHRFVKIFNVDDHKVIVMMQHHLREHIITEIDNPQDMKISLIKFADLEREDNRFACEYVKFFEVKSSEQAIIQQIKDTCDNLQIQCLSYERDSECIYISSADIFSQLPITNLQQLQPPNPLLTPVRGTSSLHIQLLNHRHEEPQPLIPQVLFS